MEKTVKEVFKDYNSDSFEFNEARIKTVNVFKKTNKIEIVLITDKQIKILDLLPFEKYLKKRFDFKEIVIKLEFVNCENTETEIGYEEWSSIIEYMAYKYPLTKALLKDSTVSMDNNTIKVILPLKGKQVLKTRKIDIAISEILQNIFNKKYKIEFEEKDDADFVKKLEEQNKQAEKDYLLLIQREQEEKKSDDKNDEIKQEDKQEDKQIQNSETSKSDEKKEEDSPLIYGRSLKIKEELVKVEDLSVDSGRVLLDGEIINFADPRELKSGKILTSFDLYDGTSTITCKAFLESDKSKEIIGKLKGAKGVKIEGTAQFDPFAKELGIIANTIIESTGIKKEKREDNAPVKRVELHMHTQMSQMDGMTSAEDLINRAI